MLIFETPAGSVKILDEPAFTIGSVDNVRSYPVEVELDPADHSSSTHGLFLNEEPLAVFSNSGGATGVHSHSAVYVDGSLYLAIGNTIVSLRLSPFKVLWKLKADVCTCFGVHYDPARQALISHGELSIARFSSDGAILWSTVGKDIFWGRLTLRPRHIEAIDFGDRLYRFDFSEGMEINGDE